MSLASRFVRSGKVRDIYRLGDGRLLLVASDRLSAFDVVLPTPIPDKGKVLTGLSRFWFAETARIVPNHLLGTDPDALPEELRLAVVHPSELARDDDETASEALRGRMMICRELDILPVEVIVRGYLAGSGWRSYRDTGELCGLRLPDGLQEGDRLPEPILTPSTKAGTGEHDENITFAEMIELLGGDRRASDLAERVRAVAIRLYGYGAAVAERVGILVADTKFEFGLLPAGGREQRSEEERLILIDEVLTPDSSRFWPSDTYAPGGPQRSFDKQFVRDYLEAIKWNKQPPVPSLPDDVVMKTREKYIEAFRRLTGRDLA